MKKKTIGHQARKRFGQNFLTDQAIIQQIIASIGPKPGQCLVEIGPGLGALTEHLLDRAGALHAVELDRDLVPILRTQFFNYPGLQLHEADALKFDYAQLYDQANSRPLRIVGNLPYNISTPLIFHLLSYHAIISDMHFMLQKEVVQRLAASPNDKNYGRLSIMMQYYCQVESLFNVPAQAFRPAPKVESAIVRLIPYSQLPQKVDNITLFEQVLKTAFSQRRKTLRNNLKPLMTDQELADLDIDPNARPEQLEMSAFIRITDYLNKTKEE